MIKKSLVIVVACVIIFSVSVISQGSGSSVQKSILGSDNTGNVTKITYSYKNSPDGKIAVISGMHPRETLSKNVSLEAVRNYAESNRVNIVNYVVEVNENSDYVRSGRNKGEYLVANYVIPDILKSNYDLVIICHDHKKGYGDGLFYIATPTMDSKSLAMAEKFRQISPEYKYFQRDPDKRAKSTSISRVDKPITDSGTPVFVYETPEWYGHDEAYNEAFKLIDTAYKVP
jgi:hypothetical protein